MWDANLDIQPITDYFSCVVYMTDRSKYPVHSCGVDCKERVGRGLTYYVRQGRLPAGTPNGQIIASTFAEHSSSYMIILSFYFKQIKVGVTMNALMKLG